MVRRSTRISGRSGKPVSDAAEAAVGRRSLRRKRKRRGRDESDGSPTSLSDTESEGIEFDEGSSSSDEQLGDESSESSENDVLQVKVGRGRQFQRPGKRAARGRSGVKGRGAPRAVSNLDWQKWQDDIGGCEGAWGNDDDDIDVDWEGFAQNRLAIRDRAPSEKLLMPLLPFQQEWLGWSLQQEESEWKGGILADEMGMGKTIQAISLIVSSPPVPLHRDGSHVAELPSTSVNPCPRTQPNAGGIPPSDAKELPQVKATLVVCPLVAVFQWRNEIQRFTDGSVKVMVYHGAKRCADLVELADYDVVLTTFSIVETEFRKNIMAPKVSCKWCRRRLNADKMAIHLRFFCGPTAEKTEKQAKQWKKRKDVEAKHPGKDLDQAGSSGRQGNQRVTREQLMKSLSEALAQGEQASPNAAWRKNSLLHSVKWARIVLDEAHSIKDRRCNTAKAVYALESVYKWALSGTPLQNRVGELYSLVRYLQIYPYSYYFCKKCNCKSLEHRFGGQCECGHSPLLHFCWWNKFVANPIKKWGYAAGGRKAMLLLKHKVLDSILLRRTKKERAADLALPPRTTYVRTDDFDVVEADFYQALYTQSQAQYDSYVTAGTLLNNYAHIFDLLTRLRQAVNHPYLVLYSPTATSIPGKQASAFAPGVAQNSCSIDPTCGICHDPVEDPVASACEHLFCRVCIQQYIYAASGSVGGEAGLCPTCDKPLTIDLFGGKDDKTPGPTNGSGYKRKSILSRLDLGKFHSSTKIEALREEIMIMLQKDPSAKAIVFSQFTSMLDLIGYVFDKCGISFVKLDGSMTISARDQMIEKFTNVAECKVFLMSLKAGGIALNLTVASHVFLMDPWWNPAVEQQAQDRIHRLGQYKPIRVTRFIIENTVEARILKLQEKKQLVFEGTIGGSAEALGKLTPEDLQFLFTR